MGICKLYFIYILEYEIILKCLSPKPKNFVMINCYPVLHIKKQYSCFIAETRNRETRAHLESWRTQAYYTDRPRDVNPSSSELRTKGLQSFYRQTIVGNTSC